MGLIIFFLVSHIYLVSWVMDKKIQVDLFEVISVLRSSEFFERSVCPMRSALQPKRVDRF